MPVSGCFDFRHRQKTGVADNGIAKSICDKPPHDNIVMTPNLINSIL
jgi:hypothetical protein